MGRRHIEVVLQAWAPFIKRAIGFRAHGQFREASCSSTKPAQRGCEGGQAAARAEQIRSAEGLVLPPAVAAAEPCAFNRLNRVPLPLEAHEEQERGRVRPMVRPASALRACGSMLSAAEAISNASVN